MIFLALPTSAFGADSVLIRDEEGFAEMVGNSGWRDAARETEAPASSLLFDNPTRRKSAQWRREEQRITGFGVQEELDGKQPPTDSEGNESSDPRGIAWSVSPARIPDGQLTITGTYINSPVSETPDVGKPSGSAGAVSVDSKLPARGQLHLHGELAYSNFDADGQKSWFDGETGRALAAGLSYIPESKGPTTIQFDAGFREVGPGFHSVANPGLADDQRRTWFGASLNRHGFSLHGEMSRTLDNFSDDSAGPALETDSYQLRGEYAAASTKTKNGFFPFDNPRFSFGVARNRTQDHGNQTGAWPTDREDSKVDFSIAFSPGRAQWSVGQSLSRQEDHTDFHLDYLTRKSRLQASLPLQQNVNLSSTLEQSRQEYENGYEFDETSATFRLSLSGENGKRTSFSLKHQGTESSDGSVDETRLSAGIRVDRPLPALPGDPKVWVGGSYETLASRGKESESGYRIFFGLEMKLGTTG